MRLDERYSRLIDYFSTHQPDAETELEYQDPYQLLVAVILSAQCTDKRVNMITPEFFSRFPDVESLAGATQEDIFALIKSCSYPNNKARNLLGMAVKLVHDFRGIVPHDIELLQTLPGVGRKTANVVASVAFNQPAMAVDTHVFRVSERIGLTRGAKTPLDAEKQLVMHIPRDKINVAHHWLILHGRYTCQARKPKCAECPLTDLCLYYEKAEKTRNHS